MKTNKCFRVICSFHDLAPHSKAYCELFLEMFKEAGGTSAVLLVVPKWHGGPSLDSDKSFVEWLHKKQDEGHEICAHGFEHLSLKSNKGAIPSVFINRFYTDHEAEFWNLDCAESRIRINESLKVFQNCGFYPVGFTAPAWLYSRKAVDAAREAGFSYITTLSAIHLLKLNIKIFAPAISLSCRSAWRRNVSALYANLAARAAKKIPIMRIAVHPLDLAHKRTLKTLKQIISLALETRKSATYQEVAFECEKKHGGRK